MNRLLLVAISVFLIVITGVLVGVSLNSQIYVSFLTIESPENDINYTNAVDAKKVPFDSQSTFNPHRLSSKQTPQNSTFSQVISELELFKKDWQNHRALSNQKIKILYDKLDTLQIQRQINPFHALKAKQWLASLLPDSYSSLKAKVAEESQQLYEQTLTAIKQDEQAHQEDERFLAYKKAESKIMRDVLAKYPNNQVQARAELQRELDKLRSRIYKVR